MNKTKGKKPSFNCCSVRGDVGRKFYLSPWKLRLLEYSRHLKNDNKIGSKKKKRNKSQSLSRSGGPYNGGTTAPEQLISLKGRVGGDLILESKSLYRKKLLGTELFLLLPKKGRT